jgi:hypothetical protein
MNIYEEPAYAEIIIIQELRNNEKTYIACSKIIKNAMIKECREGNAALLTHNIRTEFEQMTTK